MVKSCAPCQHNQNMNLKEPQEFCNTYGFIHVTTSPYYPQANGFIERTVQTVKNLFQKFKESGADPHLAMLCQRSTPLDHNIASPAELLNSRVYQANLPSISRPGLSLSADGEVNNKLQAIQDEQKSQYDKSSKLLPAMYPGDPVRVLNPHDHKWQPAIIKGSTQAPRSYMVTMTNGSTLWRTRSHIRPTGENVCIQNIPSDEPPAPSWSLQQHAQHLTWQLWTDRCPTPEVPLRNSSRLVKPPDRLDL